MLLSTIPSMPPRPCVCESRSYGAAGDPEEEVQGPACGAALKPGAPHLTSHLDAYDYDEMLGGGGGLPEPPSLTPKNQLCAADVEWMASLMQTLSASLQGADIGEFLHGM